MPCAQAQALKPKLSHLFCAFLLILRGMYNFYAIFKLYELAKSFKKALNIYKNTQKKRLFIPGSLGLNAKASVQCITA